MPLIYPALLSFLAVTLGLLGLYSLLSDLWLRDRDRVCRRVDEEFLKNQRERVRNASLFKDLGRMAAELGTSDDPRPGWRQRLELLLEQSGLDLCLRTLVALTAAGAAAIGLGCGLVLRDPIACLPGVLVGAAAPTLVVCWRRRRRMDRLTAQLPDAFDNMARVLRAGRTLTQALQAIVRDFEQPLAGEFAYCHEQQNLGLPPAASYQDLARRIDLFELRVFALAMIVQQQVGGNVADLLDMLAVALRDRLRARLRLKALTAESRLQANVLLALPAVVFVILWFTKRDYVSLLLAQPRLLLAILVSQALGALWIRSLVQTDE